MKVSQQQPLAHYQWGNGCDGWVLVDTATLSVKQERMPAGTAEQLHYHERATQFFYILNGVALFEIDGEQIEVKAKEGIQIEKGTKHRIMNQANTDLEFILSSQPSTTNDRINIL
jgi:mannose-6-phosphate isomerase-like protein (cupin superfamily)